MRIGKAESSHLVVLRNSTFVVVRISLLVLRKHSRNGVCPVVQAVVIIVLELLDNVEATTGGAAV